jgi:FkbM family methyltransferase
MNQPPPGRRWDGLASALLDIQVRAAAALGVARTTAMTEGVGRGLRFCPGASNADYGSGANELPVQAALADHLRAGSVLFDIGANVGFFTVIGARIVGESGSVHAFEPVARNAAWLRLNCRLNRLRNVHVLQVAAGEASRVGALHLADYSGGSTIDVAGRPPDYRRTLGVDVVCIDDLVESGALARPHVVKIDVEGAELHVMRGMRRTLQQYRPVVIYETDDESAAVAEERRAACDRFLQEVGYRTSTLADSYPAIKWAVRHGIAIPRT